MHCSIIDFGLGRRCIGWVFIGRVRGVSCKDEVDKDSKVLDEEEEGRGDGEDQEDYIGVRRGDLLLDPCQEEWVLVRRVPSGGVGKTIIRSNEE